MPAYFYATNCPDTSGTVWYTWNSTWSNNSTASTNYTSVALTADAWVSWNNVYMVNASAPIYQTMTQLPPETEEQRTAREQRNREYEANWKIRENERLAAVECARRLLLDQLSAKQKEEYNLKHCFIVVGGTSGKRYRIGKGRTQNVKLLDENGRVSRTYCAHPAIDCPDEDTALVQKLMIENDEDSFLKIANVS